MVTRSEPDYAWDFCGGQLAIDFTNTVGSRGNAPEDHFNVYGDVVSWAEARGAIGRAEANRLRLEAARRPAAAADALAAVVALRESLYRVIAAAAAGRKPAATDLARVNERRRIDVGRPPASTGRSPRVGLCGRRAGDAARTDRDAGHPRGDRPADDRRDPARARLRRPVVRMALRGRDAQRDAPVVRYEGVREPEQGPAIPRRLAGRPSKLTLFIYILIY